MLRRTIVLLALSALLAAPAAFADEWVGWITDEHCGAKGASEGHKSCALKCADGGAALVLYNAADEQIYKLDDQDAAKAHVGHKVKVVGTKDGDAIKVTSIAAAEAKP